MLDADVSLRLGRLRVEKKVADMATEWEYTWRKKGGVRKEEEVQARVVCSWHLVPTCYLTYMVVHTSNEINGLMCSDAYFGMCDLYGCTPAMG